MASHLRSRVRDHVKRNHRQEVADDRRTADAFFVDHTTPSDTATLNAIRRKLFDYVGQAADKSIPIALSLRRSE